MPLNAKIKTVIESLSTTTTYMRAIHQPEGNYKIGNIELIDTPLGLNANTPDGMTVTQSESSNLKYYLYPVDVFFMKKNTSIDDTGEEIDVILDEMFALANEFIDKMVANPDSGLPLTDTYTLTAQINLFDDVLSGYRVQFELPQSINPQNC